MLTDTLPTAAAVAAGLAQALEQFQRAEGAAVMATEVLAAARRSLQFVEDCVLRAEPPVLDGKNAETRAAQLRDRTVEPRLDLEAAEDAHLRAASALRVAQAQLRVWRALARLVGAAG